MQLLQATCDDSMADREASHCRFPAPEHVKTMVCNREEEPPAASAQSAHHTKSHRHPLNQLNEPTESLRSAWGWTEGRV